MSRRSAPAGVVEQTGGADPDTFAVARVEADSPWDGYLDSPNEDRIGICTSGGGIRSASFALGALQVLREEGVLEGADHLACVSGGGYLSIAHAILVSETIERASSARKGEAAPGRNDDSIGEEYFGRHAPWAAGSPEEQHLRDRLKYLAPGLRGWAWFVLNFVYGVIRHLLPFMATIYLVGFITGLAMSPWLGESLRTSPRERCEGAGCLDAGDLAQIALGGVVLVVIAGVLLSLRTWGQKRGSGSFGDATMSRLQSSAFWVSIMGIVIFFLGVAVPQLLLWLHDGWLRSLGLGVAGGLFGFASLGAAVAAWIAKNYRTKWFQILVAALVTLSAPILVLVPYVGVTYSNAQAGTRWDESPERWMLAVTSALILVALLFLDEVTSTMHLYYRERLATAFVGYRQKSDAQDGLSVLRHAQPSWKRAINFSHLRSSGGRAKMPNLIVCTAVNLSGDLPAGRLGASFTFERDWVGSPTTGYVRTEWLEDSMDDGVVTLPALMAMSGAAIAPSMGKMTIPALRFVMAMFNLRLGVWIRNPYQSSERRTPWQVQEGRLETERQPQDSPTTRTPKKQPRFRRPGGLYVFREAFGANTLDRSYVYVTDGGHWENLGLVELLRRGCGKIVVIDGSGGDTESFGTLSEAIAFARADLGVEISINLEKMRADENGNSQVGFAEGRIEYPNGTPGLLIYVRAVRCLTASQDVKGYAVRDPKFPNHPTSDQFFNEQKFEAYRALGRNLMSEAVRGKNLKRHEIGGAIASL